MNQISSSCRSPLLSSTTSNEHSAHALTSTENDGGKKLDEATAHRLSKAGIITIILHRVRNLRRPRKLRLPVAENGNVAHSVWVQDCTREELAETGSVASRRVRGTVQQLYEPPDGLHRVADPQQKRGGKSFTYNWVDGGEDEHAYATFNFKYRSLGRSLQPSLPHVTNTQL
jgi:hypothetical protein